VLRLHFYKNEFSTMTCLECSNTLPEDATTCANCGAPVESQSAVRGTEATALKTFISASLQKLMPQPDVTLDEKQFSLWKPWLIVLWFIPFLGIWVGCALVAVNWWTLGKKYWALWSWAFIALEYAASAWLMPDSVPFLIQILTSFVAWLILVAGPQIWFVQQYYGRGYDRRRWLVPIGIGLIIGFALPKIAEYLEGLSEVDASQSSAQLAAAAQNQQVVKELTVEEVVKAKSGFVVPLEISWTETALLIFSSKEARSGSAVFIGAEGNQIVFATNRHVIKVPEGANDIKRILVDGKNRLPFSIVTEFSDELDLAVIQVSLPEVFKKSTIPSAAFSELAVGEECVAIGNALGHGISVTTGIISRFDAINDGALFMIRTSAPISPGNSGGGLFRRKDGKLLGITTSTRIDKGAQNVNFALPIEYLGKLKFLEP
jgi:hypothetical protein